MTDRSGKVLLIHRYFAPDTPPYAHILDQIAAQLAGDGHDVTVLTCQPSYRPALALKAPRHEQRNGYQVVRWGVLPDRRWPAFRAANMVLMCVRVLLARRLFVGADVVMAATTPPVLVAACASRMARRHGARFIYHKQDIYPEVLSDRRQRSLLMRVLARIDAMTERRSSAVVVLSEDMAETVSRRHPSPVPISIINNFDPWPSAAECPAHASSDVGITVAFAGNIGRFQGLDAVMALVREIDADDGIGFHFFGDGDRSDEIESLAATCGHVTFHGYRAPEEVAAFVRSTADLGVVSVDPGVLRAAYPSKTMTYLRNGCPLLLIAEDSEIARMVAEAGIGITLSSGDTRALAESLRKIAADPEAIRSARGAARRVYDERFAPERQLCRWSGLVRELVRA